MRVEIGTEAFQHDGSADKRYGERAQVTLAPLSLGPCTFEQQESIVLVSILGIVEVSKRE